MTLQTGYLKDINIMFMSVNEEQNLLTLSATSDKCELLNTRGDITLGFIVHSSDSWEMWVSIIP